MTALEGPSSPMTLGQRVHGRAFVSGSEQAIARTQLSSVHLHQRPDGDVAFDSTRTSMSGGVVSFSLSRISGAVRFSSYVRLASPEMELNDAGLVPLINDKSIRNNVSLRSLRPGPWYRSSFSMIETESHWTSGGLPSGNLARLHTSFSMLNNWGWADVHGAESNDQLLHVVRAWRACLASGADAGIPGEREWRQPPRHCSAVRVGCDGR
jgi:hypothetical protein